MTNPQGTQWETKIVKSALHFGRLAGRHPKRGQRGESDVWIEPRQTSAIKIPVVLWKRLVGKKREGRRKPDGERAVVIIGADEFFSYILPYVPVGFEIQAKWTSTLNVTRTLAELRAWMKDHA